MSSAVYFWLLGWVLVAPTLPRWLAFSLGVGCMGVGLLMRWAGA